MVEKSAVDPVQGPSAAADPRIDHIRDLLVRLAAGDREVRGTSSGRGDALDAVIVGLNMLAEELATQSDEHRAAEESLRCSEERLQLALNGANDGLWDWDPVTGHIYYSPRWKGMLGYGEQEIGCSLEEWEQRLHPDDRERVTADLRANMEGRTSHYESAFRLRHKDGHWVWVLSRGRTFFDSNGKPVRVTGTHVDITRQKQLEEELQSTREQLERRVEERTRALAESEARWRSLVENAPDYVMTIDPGLRCTFINRAPPGIDFDRIVNGSILDIVFEDDRELARDELMAVFRTGQPGHVEVRSGSRDAGILWYSVRIGPVSQAGVVTAVVATGRNITERRSMVQALKESEARYRHLWENLQDAAFIAEADSGVIIETNRRGEELLGRGRGEIIGQHYRMLYPPEKAAEYEAICAQHVENGGVEYDAEVFRADGSTVPVDISVAPLNLGGRQLVLGLYHDVTDRHQVVEALRASEARYRLLWDNLNDAAFIGDAASGRIVDLNRAAERLIGRPRDAIIGMQQTQLHPPELAETYAAHFRAHITDGVATVEDAEVLRADGSRVPVDISATPMEIGGQHLLLGLFHDISRRKETLRKLQFTQTAVEQAGDAIFWIDDELRFIHVNDSACQRLGYSREELLRMTVPEVATGFARAPTIEQIRNQGRAIFKSEHRRKDGTTFPVEVTSSHFCYEGRDYFCSIARDISERVEAERIILERDANLQALAENANDGIVVGRENRHLFINHRFAQMLGYALEEVKVIPALQLVHPDERSRLAAFMRGRHAEQAVPSQYETSLLCKDGSPLSVEVTAARTTWDGEPAQLIVVRDITGRRRAEQALWRQSEDLAKVNMELEQLLYVMAHDLKAPLRAVSHLASVLESELTGLDAQQRRLFELLRGRVQRMHALIEALLSYTQATPSERLERIDVGELIAGVIAEIPIPEGFSVTVEGALPVLETDALALRQVFANLIGNALDHHDRSQGSVTVSCRESRARWEFAVSDDGPGIPTDYQKRIFEMFQLLDARDSKGRTGMGLPLVKKLVESRGGRVVLDSEGRGATFRFTWPK